MTNENDLQPLFPRPTHAATVPCMCKDRPLSECPGEWEPGCDLGNNEKYAQPAPVPADRARLASEAKRVAEVAMRHASLAYRHGEKFVGYDDVAAAIDALAAAPACPAGWRMVPVEATPAMIQAIPWPNNVTPSFGVDCYRAMIAAAPEAPKPEGGV